MAGTAMLASGLEEEICEFSKSSMRMASAG